MKLQPLADRLIVRADTSEEVSEGGVILPPTAQETTQTGSVVAVGDGLVNDDGSRRPLDVCEGDQIIYSKYGGTEITVDGDDLLVMREADVLAKVGQGAG